MSVEQEILVTGIKVVDLLAPYAKGGKIGRWHLVESERPERGGPVPTPGLGSGPHAAASFADEEQFDFRSTELAEATLNYLRRKRGEGRPPGWLDGLWVEEDPLSPQVYLEVLASARLC